ncbi:cytochrome P450 [Novosphingobium sp. PS1R-30]|uniref:Cytochrome P450 n=1 Tax=Novosphingobium anseongense TaxID=3133436 RepID=A0ABU8RXT8_9SPHN
MQALADLDLYHLRWEEPAFAADPLPEFAKARAQHPWIAKCDAGYVVFDYQAIRALYIQDDHMRPSFDGVVDIMGCKGSPWGRFAEEQMLALPSREHAVLRRAFALKFSPRYANSLRPVMQEAIERLLDEWTPRERIDFEEFASYYPISVTARMAGAPVSVIPGLRQSMETLGLAFSMDPTRVPALDKAFLHMDDFASTLLAEREANPQPEGSEPDLLDMLLEAGRENDISRRQIVDLLIFLFVAGYDTSKNVLTYMMTLMIEQPDIYRRCAEDIEYCRKVVEETLRFFNPGTSFRCTATDVEYREVLIPKDTMLFFPLSISGHDPNVFDRPDAFDPDRTIVAEKRHIAFGLGKHMCLGQYIARTQLQEGIHAIAKRMLEPRFAGEIGWRPFPGVWGMKGLPIAFTAA